MRGKRNGVLAVVSALSAALLVFGAVLFREAPGSASDDLPVLRGEPALTSASDTTAPPASAPPAPDTAPPTTGAATPTPVVAAPAPTPPPLPQPQPAPADPYADVPLVPVGQIEIPKIGVSEVVNEGVWRTVIDQGPGHWPGTAEPGGWGNSVYAGHRSTYTEPFRRIAELVPGDEIVVRTDRGTFTYQVTGSEIVDDSALYIVDQTPGRTITLFACHPVGSAAQRYVVHGTLVSEAPAP
ncbi:MAG: sortase [Actinomycetota bacterium]